MAAFKTTVGFAEEPELGNKGMLLTVKKGNDIKGHLMIGKASLHWYEKHAKKNASKVSWDDLMDFMRQQQKVQVSRP